MENKHAIIKIKINDLGIVKIYGMVGRKNSYDFLK